MRSLLPLILLLAATGIYGQEVRTERKTVAVPITEVMPTVGFSFTSDPNSRLHLPEGPVKIMGFGDGMFASEVEVQNDSQKQVKSIKLDWYLFDSQTSTKETKRGRTKEIKLTLDPGKRKVVGSQIPSFDELFKSLTTDGVIGGSWFMEAVVGKIEFSDGTEWTRAPSAAQQISNPPPN